MFILLSVLISFFPEDLQPWYWSCRTGAWSEAAYSAQELYAADSTNVNAHSAMIVAGCLAEDFGSDPADFKSFRPDSSSSLSFTAAGALDVCAGDVYTADAERELTAALELDLSNTLAWYVLGKLNIRESRLQTAMSCFSRVLEEDGLFLPAQLDLGRTEARVGDRDSALKRFSEIGDPATAVGREAVAEYYVLACEMGYRSKADSAFAEIVFMEETHKFAISGILLDMGRYSESATLAEQLLESSTSDSTQALYLLGRSSFALEENGTAEEAFEALLERTPLSTAPMLYLGRISQMEAETDEAVDWYLRVLEKDPANGEARQRLREIAGDSYDPQSYTMASKGLSVSASADLSVQRGGKDLFEWGGSTSLSYRYDRRGSSVDASLGGRSVTWEETRGLFTDTLDTNRGWASVGTDYWFRDDYYVQVESSWDRQMYTERPWQVSSYAALGWEKRMLSWFRFSPRLGIGSVNARWTSGSSETRTNDFSVFAAASLNYGKPHTFIREANISGSLYFPPDNPENFISKGNVYMAFRTWSPLYVAFSYVVDYTRTPEIESWSKFNTSFTTSINLDIY
ncbi:MAG: tetratricopeptide repeat protein [Candidatus Aegiribacteria sp.]|nr:tetratricopeptide repeat protein [Candidatus Aegiribacteria sp.]MBD3293861.1 tetratricopeptide repeat protein [Candidatus Fermentibacteria bacterium]